LKQAGEFSKLANLKNGRDCWEFLKFEASWKFQNGVISKVDGTAGVLKVETSG